MNKWQALWQELNERQQTYLRLIYEYDQAQERNEKMRVAREWNSRPADQWRWILYANLESGHTPLKQAIKDAGMVDPGTGSTFKALEERGYILARSEGVPSHRRSDLIVWVRLTTKGRRMVRQALAISAPARLPAGTLREEHYTDAFHSCRGLLPSAGTYYGTHLRERPSIVMPSQEPLRRRRLPGAMQTRSLR